MNDKCDLKSKLIELAIIKLLECVIDLPFAPPPSTSSTASPRSCGAHTVASTFIMISVTHFFSHNRATHSLIPQIGIVRAQRNQAQNLNNFTHDEQEE